MKYKNLLIKTLTKLTIFVSKTMNIPEETINNLILDSVVNYAMLFVSYLQKKRRF